MRDGGWETGGVGITAFEADSGDRGEAIGEGWWHYWEQKGCATGLRDKGMCSSGAGQRSERTW